MFQVKPHSDRLPAKDRVLGVWTDDGARAYPVAAFDSDHRVVEEVLGGRRFTVEFDGSANSLRVANADPVVQWMYSLWFAWYAMRPETSVFER